MACPDISVDCAPAPRWHPRYRPQLPGCAKGRRGDSLSDHRRPHSGRCRLGAGSARAFRRIGARRSPRQSFVTGGLVKQLMPIIAPQHLEARASERMHRRLIHEKLCRAGCRSRHQSVRFCAALPPETVGGFQSLPDSKPVENRDNRNQLLRTSDGPRDTLRRRPPGAIRQGCR